VQSAACQARREIIVRTTHLAYQFLIGSISTVSGPLAYVRFAFGSDQMADIPE
jgi:hypothetical protein